MRVPSRARIRIAATLGVLSPIALVLATPFQEGEAVAPQEDQQLTRVYAPGAQASDQEREQIRFALQDPEHWRSRLVDPDLDARERHYERLMEIARRDPGALEQIDEWSRDQRDPELAWTARLALRELRRVPAGQRGLLFQGSSPGLPSSAASLEEFEARLEAMLQAMGRGGLAPHDLGRWRLHAPVPGTTIEQSASNVQIQIGPEGAKVVVTEQVDGEEKTREYEAETIEEIFEAHPELEGQLRVYRLESGGHGDQVDGALGPQMRLQIEQLIDDVHGNGPAWEDGLRTDVLGVYLRSPTPEEAARAGLEESQGMLVERTERGTIAAMLDIQRGDVLVGINGRPVVGRDTISEALCDRPAGGEVRLEIVDSWGVEHTRTWRPTPEAPEPPQAPEPPEDPEPLESERGDF